MATTPAPAAAPDNRPLPSWYSPEPESVTVTADKTPTLGDDVGDFAANVGTGVARIPGAIIELPHMINHTLNWLQAKAQNLGDGGNRTGADIDKDDPFAKHTLSSEDVDNGVFKGVSAVAGHEVHPYEPTSFIGKLLQAGVTGAGAGLIDPAALLGAFRGGATGVQALTGAMEGMGGRVAKTAIASDAANATQQAFPDEPGLAALSALVAHTGASTAEVAARAGGGLGRDAVRQVFSPTAQGETEAGRALKQVDNTLPGLAAPPAADIAARTADVRAATDAIGPGLPDWQAGANLRAGLQQRVQGLEQAREEATAPLREVRDNSPTLINTDPIHALIAKKLNVAAGAQQDALKGALSDLHLADGGLREDAAQLAAARTAISSRISDATRAGDGASAAHLMDVRKVLDAQINGAVPEAGQYTSKYAELSKPLDPTQHGAVAKVLDRDQFNSRFTFPEERVPDLFLRSNATRSDLAQLVAAHGGDKSAALGALQDHLAGITQRAVQPDGTLDTVAFAKVMQPYQKSLGNVGMYFPELARKFASAKAAQGTLDTMLAQRGLADAVGNGALRDKDGVVTGASFGQWVRSNKDAITKTQSPGAAMRLESIATALQKTHPGELADVLKSEWAPTAIGMATGGLEGGVLGTLLHKSTKVAFGGLDAKRMAAFSAAIEQATLDPAYAQRLAGAAAKRGGGISPVRGLVRAILATPLAVNSGRN
ncbi:MAG: hypothetical protein H0U98_01045 [Alphaproteobacteria bacterium]|nr:hypothetical protein [Alphaproteobacteria bacterium]